MTLLAILGPTATGKSDLAVGIAKRTGAAIVSVDSMQVYRGMDIGTAKPSREVRNDVPHRMIDIADPSTTYSVAEYQRDGAAAIEELEDAGIPVVLVGGSGLYFRALIDPLHFPGTNVGLRRELDSTDLELLTTELLEADPDAGVHVDLANTRRVVRAVEVLRLTGATPSIRRAQTKSRQVQSYAVQRPVVAICFDPGTTLHERIENRLDRMIVDGLVKEVRKLADRLGPTACQAVGYKELLPHVAGQQSLEAARAAIVNATMNLAKRQKTFFRRDPRIRWLPWHDDQAERQQAVLEAVEELSWIS